MHIGNNMAQTVREGTSMFTSSEIFTMYIKKKYEQFIYDCMFEDIYLFQHFSSRSCLENFATSPIANLCDGVGVILAEK